MHIKHRSELLFKPTKTGATQQWQAFVGADANGVYKWTEFGQVGGAIQRSELTHVEGKNIGKKNETRPLDQAIREVDAEARKQRDKRYRPEGEDYDGLLLPMLAHEWTERKHTANYPVLVQPKLDGVRGVFDGVQFHSRWGKVFPAACVKHLLVDPFSGFLLDGEFMLPSFQATTKYVTKARPDQHRLEFHVFDMIPLDSPKVPFNRRIDAVQTTVAALQQVNPQLKLVSTVLAHSEAQINEHHARFVQEGYEGTIVRSYAGLYEVGTRSVGVLKKKDFVRAEFEIVGYTDGDGKEAGAVMYFCVTKDGKGFGPVRPRGSYDDRRARYKEAAEDVGKFLTVEYQNLTDDGIPRFPVGIVIRDYE